MFTQLKQFSIYQRPCFAGKLRIVIYRLWDQNELGHPSNWAISAVEKKTQELIDWIFHFAVNYFRVNFLWSLMLVPSLIFSSVLYMPAIGDHRELRP